MGFYAFGIDNRLQHKVVNQFHTRKNCHIFDDYRHYVQRSIDAQKGCKTNNQSYASSNQHSYVGKYDHDASYAGNENRIWQSYKVKAYAQKSNHANNLEKDTYEVATNQNLGRVHYFVNLIEVNIGSNRIYKSSDQAVVFQKEEGKEQNYESTHDKVACKGENSVGKVGELEDAEGFQNFGRDNCFKVGVGRHELIFIQESLYLLYRFGIVVCNFIYIEVCKGHCLRYYQGNKPTEKHHENQDKQNQSDGCRNGFADTKSFEAYFGKKLLNWRSHKSQNQCHKHTADQKSEIPHKENHQSGNQKSDYPFGNGRKLKFIVVHSLCFSLFIVFFAPCGKGGCRFVKFQFL